MKRICIDEKVCSKYKISPRDFMYLLFLTGGKSEENVAPELARQGWITPKYSGGKMAGYAVMDKGYSTIESVLLESERDNVPDDRLEYLSKELRGLFPEGRKEGTSLYWRGNTKEISNRLRGFFIKFGNYTDEEILDAAKRYVSSFMDTGSLRNMRLLKYFIWKKVDTGHGMEESSDLLSFIENSDEDTHYSDDWTTNLK